MSTYGRYRITAPTMWIALTLATSSAFADIFTWTDENGVTHYSTSRPAGRTANAFPADPAFRAPAATARPVAGETAEAQALRQRVETLEALLDDERTARVSDLKDQLESERDRVRRLEAERGQWSQIGGIWTQPTLAPTGMWWNPAPVIVVPGHGRSGKPDRRDKARIRHDSDRLPYPSISGPSSNLR